MVEETESIWSVEDGTERAIRAIQSQSRPTAAVHHEAAHHVMAALEKEILRNIGADQVNRLTKLASHIAEIDRQVQGDKDRQQKAETSDGEESVGSFGVGSEPHDDDPGKAGYVRNRMSSVLVKDPQRTDLLQGAQDQEGAETKFLHCEVKSQLECQMIKCIKTSDFDGPVLGLLAPEVSERLVEDYKRVQVYFRSKTAMQIQTRSRQRKTVELTGKLGKIRPTELSASADTPPSSDGSDKDSDAADARRLGRKNAAKSKRHNFSKVQPGVASLPAIAKPAPPDPAPHVAEERGSGVITTKASNASPASPRVPGGKKSQFAELPSLQANDDGGGTSPDASRLRRKSKVARSTMKRKTNANATKLPPIGRP